MRQLVICVTEEIGTKEYDGSETCNKKLHGGRL